jgi:peptidoglycan glycosyltransferase
MSEHPRPVPPRRLPGKSATQRQIVVRRAIALGVIVVVVAIAAVLVIGSFGKAGAESAVGSYANAWAAGDTRTMYEQISPQSQSDYPYKKFKAAIEKAHDTATVRGIRITGVHKTDNQIWNVSSRVATRAFGTIDKPLQIPVEGSGDTARIKWSEQLVFPGIGTNGSLARDTDLPPRASLETRDNVALASGATRTSPLGAAASNAAGSVGAIPDSAKARYYALGYPENAQVGTSGLEKAFEVQLAGKPGGTLRAGGETIATSEPRKGQPVKTTIDSRLQQAAATQMGTRQGGIVVLKPRSGEILGYAGTPFSNLQPPGSTFKIITLSGGLEDRIIRPSDIFPVETSAQLSGVAFENADREACGGTLVQSFAKSCNSVFGPIAAKLGAKKLINVAERFGFDKKPTIQGAATSHMPNEQTLNDDLQVASAGIGQSTVQATALQMASVAATIALRGQRPQLTLDYKDHGRRAPTRRVIDPAVAQTVQNMMLSVVSSGTGVLAQIPGVKVAGKTGTAELKSTQTCDPNDPKTQTTTTLTTGTTTTTTKGCAPPTTDDTDAWFTSYAPAGNPQFVVCVMFVGAGQGRYTAAPAAKAILQTALHKTVTVAPPVTPVTPVTTTAAPATTP